MAKKLIVAPAAGGKTAYALDLARRTAVSLQAEVRVCVPTGLQARAWRERLAAAGGAIGIHVFTFDHLVAACLNEAGETYTELSEAVQYRLLQKVIADVPLVHYAPIKDKPGFVQVAQRVISELKSAPADPQQFRSAIAASGNKPRLRELADIYISYQEQLQIHKWADREGLLWLAVEALESRSPDACRNWPLLIIDGFDDFTSSQLALLRLLAARVGDLLITLPKAELVEYGRYRYTRKEVEQALGITGEALAGSGIPEDAPLYYLARHIFEHSPTTPLSSSAALTLREAPDRAAEVRTALRWLKQRVVWDGIAPNQLALLARNLYPYRVYIQQIAQEFGIPIRLIDGLPLATSPIIAALLELLRLHLPAGVGQEVDLPRRQVVSTWRSPYFNWGDGDSGITAADADLLDALARQQRVIRGLNQWQAAFDAGMSANEIEPVDEDEGGGEQMAGTAVAQLHNKFDRFLSMTKPPSPATTMKEFVRWLETLIGPDPYLLDPPPAPPDSLQIVAQARANLETATADIAALRALKDILHSMVWAEESLGRSTSVSYTSFFYELLGAISSTYFTLPPKDGRLEILVANVTQVRGASFEAVAILGMSDGSFPSTINEDPFLRDDDRKYLREQHGIILKSSTQSAEREFFYEAITRPRQKLLLTRPMLAENGAEWVASPFWEATGRIIDNTAEKIASDAVLPAAETASWAEWWEAVAAAKDGHVLAEHRDPSAWQRIDTAAQIWQDRLTAAVSIWDGDLRSLSDELASQYGPETVWSASRLELYQACGFSFFTRYILGLAPRPEPAEGLDTRQLGSLYHRIFERVAQVKELDHADATAVRELVTAVAAPLLDAAPKEEGFRETPWWAHTRREIVDNVARSIVALADDGYEFLQAEASFGFDNQPLTVRIGADQLKLRGFIDRVDRRKDGQIRIVDYKLGGKSGYSIKNFREGKKLQLPLYALAAQEALGLGHVEDGFYWHFRTVDASPFRLAKADGGVEGAIETSLAYAWETVQQVRDGRFAPHPPQGGCPAYCPAAAFCCHYSPGDW